MFRRFAPKSLLLYVLVLLAVAELLEPVLDHVESD